MAQSIGIVIPTYQGAKHLPFLLPFLLQSSLKPKILVIDSSSSDGTVELAKKMGVKAISIPKKEFNHGTTREIGRKYLETTIAVMMTQDAYPKSPDLIERLVAPILQEKASVSYARQLPHSGASLIASFSRAFNYSKESHIRGIKDISTYGVYTFFCSNSCAAYCNKSLNKIGGFPSISFGEDTLCVAKLLHAHHKIAYVAEAEVYHSHDHTLKEEFIRHYEMARARESFQHLISVAGKEGQRGKEYVLGLLHELWKQEPYSIPYALTQTLFKFCGYRLGQLNFRYSNQKKFW